MYTCNDNELDMIVSKELIGGDSSNTNVIPLGYFLYKGDNLETSCRVKTACGLIQEKNLGSSNELACNTDSTFLSTTDTLPDRSTDDAVGLLSQAKGFYKSVDSSHTFGLCQCAAYTSDDLTISRRTSYFL